jgi:2-polyprenyl-3-methyl-5-hydroxy-6-metoxy-1,4-benzoquinol methylase
MTGKTQTQEAYWDRQSRGFDKIYSHDKSWLGTVLDQVFRKDMYQRYQFALFKSQPIQDKTILDVGCGSGRFSVEFAKRGARKVTGIDISRNMILLAEKISGEHGAGHICEFQKVSILDFHPQITYDVTLAMGLLDYIRDPLPALLKMAEVTKGSVIISFPRAFTWRAPIRKLRLRVRGCNVYFYSQSRIRSLLAQAGLRIGDMKKVGKLYCVVAHAKT